MKNSQNIVLVYPQNNTLLFGIPLGIAYIAGVLREDGHNIHIVDMRYRDEETLFETIAKASPLIVGFYVSSEIVPRVLELAARIRSKHPEIVLVAGGPHSTIDPDSILNGDIDIIVRGEGELTMRSLVDAISSSGSPASVNGVSYKLNGTIVHNKDADFIENLDELPFPAYDLFPDIKRSLSINLAWPNHLPFTHILVSRGCPFQCTFCQPTLDKMFGKRIRRLSPRRTVELLEHLITEYKIKEVFFEDDLLLSRAWKPWLLELTGTMAERQIGLRWWGQARANSADRDILIAANNAGCYMVMCGIESGCQKTLDFYKKNISIEDIRSFFSLCEEVGMMTVGQIIFGAPEESMEDARETITLMKQVEPDLIWVSILTPYPGTFLTQWLIEHEIPFEHNLAKIDRGIRKRKMNSLMTEDEIFRSVAELTQAHVSWRKLFKSKLYRDAFYKKVANLLYVRQYGKLMKLVFWLFLRPALKPLQTAYYRGTTSKSGELLKRTARALRPY